MSDPRAVGRHVSTYDLALYVHDELSQTSARAVEAHAAECAACGEALAREARLELAMYELASHEKSSRERSRRVLRAAPVLRAAGVGLAMAAAAVLALGASVAASPRGARPEREAARVEARERVLACADGADGTPCGSLATRGGFDASWQPD